ncbi:MAG: ABC transporter substrate-binding protein [Pseudanabaenaceae cyanobacterium SKYGB_i_bin29]|nr:ABC transporter substrate-binding protein [Pseudanabaenaceae cyanobacterium SKYG29]MDW8421660.1 ABC transporter substrate-binding protein [Pseudanabaenaceae cyanobacterium SKYGB_i_bin29]
MRQVFHFLALCLTICLAIIACQSPSPEGKAIPIGIAVAQTSNVALLGQEQVIGAKLAESYFNEQGGVNGTPIKLIFQDTGGDEQGASNAFTTLINQDKVVAIVGPTLSQQAFSASPIADRAGVPVIAPSNTAKGIPQIGKFVSRVSAPVTAVAPKAIEAVLQKYPNIKRVAVFYAQDDAFSKSETEVFQQTVQSKNLTLVTVQTFQTKDTDFQTQITNALKFQPDLVIISGLAADGGNLVKQLRELDYKNPIIGGNGLNTANIFSVCKQFCDGIFIAQAYSPELDTPINKTFRLLYEQQKQQIPPQFTAQAFTAVQVIVEALRRVDNPTGLPLDTLRQKLNDTILSHSYDTPLGKISFTAEGEILQNQFYVAQIEMDSSGEKGRFKFIL